MLQRRAIHHLLPSGGTVGCGGDVDTAVGGEWIPFRSIVAVEIGTDDLRTHYDLIVVGTGPAGLTLARKYAELTGGTVLVIESGRRSRDNNDAQKSCLGECYR